MSSLPSTFRARICEAKARGCCRSTRPLNLLSTYIFYVAVNYWQYNGERRDEALINVNPGLRSPCRDQSTKKSQQQSLQRSRPVYGR